MLSLTSFKDELCAYIRLMTKNGAYVDLAYKGRAYRLHIEDLGFNVERKPYTRKPRKDDVKVITTKCSECGGMAINDVCMSPRHQKLDA